MSSKISISEVVSKLEPLIGDQPAVLKYLNSICIDFASLKRFVFEDSSVRYTRNLVTDFGGRADLIVLVWTPTKRSDIHDHANAHCVMKVVSGELIERRYTTDVNLLKSTGLAASDGCQPTAYIADNLGLHSMGNESETGEYAVSLHLYFPPYASQFGCNIYKEGKKVHVKSTYYSINGERV